MTERPGMKAEDELSQEMPVWNYGSCRKQCVSLSDFVSREQHCSMDLYMRYNVFKSLSFIYI